MTRREPPTTPPEGDWCDLSQEWVDDCEHCADQQAIAEDYAEMVREGN